MLLKKLKITPSIVRLYLFAGLLLIALPSILGLYSGHTGKLLVATGQISIEPFYQSVIYLQRHGLSGSYGIIINKPIQSRNFRRPFPELQWDVDLYNGGPVSYGVESYLLVHDEGGRSNGIVMAPAKKLQEEYPDIYGLLTDGGGARPHRLYVGYSGWKMFQLNLEMLRGDWAVIDYDAELVFHTPADEVWARAMKKIVGEHLIVPGDV